VTARSLTHDALRETGLVLSVGLASGQAVAKVASDLEKPDGFVAVPLGTEASFLAPLPVRRLSGIGPRAEAALLAEGLRTIGQLVETPLPLLERLLGSRAEYIARLAVGDDDRPVATWHERKSVGSETTFAHDLPLGDELREQLQGLIERVTRRVEEKDLCPRTVTLNLRQSDFTTLSRQVTLTGFVPDDEALAEAAFGLLDKLAPPAQKFRLIGVQFSNWADQAESQLRLPFVDKSSA
jgi:DNA polymerase-4